MHLDPQARRVLGSEHGMQLPAQGEAARAADHQHAHFGFHGDKERRLDPPSGQLLAPDGSARRIAYLAGVQTVGEQADRLAADTGIDGLAARCGADIRGRRQQPHLPRVLKPQPRGAEIGGKAGEAAVCEHLLPDARRQRPSDFEEDSVAIPAVCRDDSAALRRRQRRHERSASSGLFPDEYGGAVSQKLLCLRRRAQDAAPGVQQRFQPKGGKAALNLPQAWAQILPLLVGETDQLRLQSAAFEQAKGAQQKISLARPGLTAEDRVVAGDSPAPQFTPWRGMAQPVFPQRQHKLHRVVQLFRTHPEPQRRRPDHASGSFRGCGENPFRRLRRLLRACPEGEREADLRLPAPARREPDFRPHQRRKQRPEPAADVRAEVCRGVRGKTEPFLRPAGLGQAAKQQLAVPLLRLHAELPVGPVAVPVAFLRKDGRKGQGKRDFTRGVERDVQADDLAQLSLRALSCKCAAQAVSFGFPAAARLAEFPFCIYIAGQQRPTVERDCEAGIVALRAVDAGIAEKRGALARVPEPQAVRAV